jgi:hypothetical protein
MHLRDVGIPTDRNTGHRSRSRAPSPYRNLHSSHVGDYVQWFWPRAMFAGLRTWRMMEVDSERWFG